MATGSEIGLSVVMLAFGALAVAVIVRLRIWFSQRASRCLTLALLQLCLASLFSPPALGQTIEHLTQQISGPCNLPDLFSNLLVVTGAWTLLRMSARIYGFESQRRQYVPVTLFVAAMVATYIASPRLHGYSVGGLLSTTGSGAKVYLAVYSTAVVWAAVQVLFVARTLYTDAEPGSSLGRIVAPLTAAAFLSTAYGISIGSFMWFDADDIVPGIHMSYISASWWLATTALTALAIAGVTGVR